MSTAPLVASAPVTLGGDPRARARSGWRRARGPLLIVGILVLVGLLAALLRPLTGDEPLAPDNPAPDGARALAEVLGRQGVEVVEIATTAEAVAAATSGVTLLVVGTYPLDTADVTQLAATSADLVLAGPEDSHLRTLTDGALETGYAFGTRTVGAGCSDPDATAAETVTSRGWGLIATDERATVCFAAADDEGGAYGWVSVGTRRVAVLDDAAMLSNRHIDEDGTAALALRVLGRHPTLLWFRPTAQTAPEVGMGDLLPAAAGPLFGLLAVLVAAAALWRGRALGRVVAEPLPVAVSSVETTLGRGRLYRASRARGHAAASLRAGTALRTAARLGLSRAAGATEVIDALARATGRSTAEIASLLYGPPPADDTELVALATALTQLESEVHPT
ncbi:DUF4350 domain-containing protein [Actinotalea sp.]|uniref:DUF4350 domain-containing protein n=1 Tax=Actinotalea sp. TaxID=1872145 RepID=UPI003563F367